MPRFLVLLGAVALLGAACSGGGEEQSAPAPAPPQQLETAPVTTTEPTPRPERPPGEVLERFVTAARGENAKAMWRLLSNPTRSRFGPTLGKFRNGIAADLSESVGSFLEGRSALFLDEQITDRFAVAAFGGRRQVGKRERFAAYASALRLEDGAWKIELGGPIRLSAVVPDPGEVESPNTQVAAGIASDTPVVEGGLWLDGRTVSGRSSGADDLNVTMFGQPDGQLDRGPHAVVAFASTFEDASALAWMFTTR